MADSDWYTDATARQVWRDAPAGGILKDHLDAAREQCLEYAPTPKQDANGNPIIPSSWKLAQLMQAQAMWRASQTGPGDVVGIEGQTMRVYSMGWQVKHLLRPPSAMPGIG